MWNVEWDIHFYKLGENCIFFLYLSYIIVKKPHKEVTTGHLENKTKFEVSDNTSVTPSVQQTVIGNMSKPSEKIQ